MDWIQPAYTRVLWRLSFSFHENCIVSSLADFCHHIREDFWHAYTSRYTTHTYVLSSWLTLSLLMSYTVYMELIVKPEIITSYIYIYIYIYIYMDLGLATLKAVYFYLLQNVSTLNQCRKLSCVTVVCKHFAIYQDYPNYRWVLIR
jgi:hypothetical protein